MPSTIRNLTPGKRRPIDGLPGFETLEWYDRSQRLWLVTAQTPDDYQIGEGELVRRSALPLARRDVTDLARRYHAGFIDLGGNVTGKQEGDR